MANIVFNIAKGRVAELYNRVKSNDPLSKRCLTVKHRSRPFARMPLAAPQDEPFGPVPVGLESASAVVPDGAGFAHHLLQPLGWHAVAYHRWRGVRNGSILCRINGLHDLGRC